MTYVIKRDGSTVKWDSNKIVNPVRKPHEPSKEDNTLAQTAIQEPADNLTADTIYISFYSTIV